MQKHFMSQLKLQLTRPNETIYCTVIYIRRGGTFVQYLSCFSSSGSSGFKSKPCVAALPCASIRRSTFLWRPCLNFRTSLSNVCWSDCSILTLASCTKPHNVFTSHAKKRLRLHSDKYTPQASGHRDRQFFDVVRGRFKISTFSKLYVDDLGIVIGNENDKLNLCWASRTQIFH